MPEIRSHTTLLLYIILSILILVIPLSTVAFAQSTTPGGPGPLEGFVDSIMDRINETQEAITDAFVDACESVTDGSPGVKFFCDVVLQGRIER